MASQTISARASVFYFKRRSIFQVFDDRDRLFLKTKTLKIVFGRLGMRDIGTENDENASARTGRMATVCLA